MTRTTDMIIFRNVIKYTIGLIWLIPITLFGFFLALLFAYIEFICNGESFINEFSSWIELIREDWKPIRR